MGMSSSQARLLSLTARMHDIEYKAQRIEAQKLQMANESKRVYEDYLNALDMNKFVAKSMTSNGSLCDIPFTANTIYSYGQFSEQLALSAPSGQIFIPSELHQNFQSTNNLQDFLSNYVDTETIQRKTYTYVEHTDDYNEACVEATTTFNNETLPNYYEKLNQYNAFSDIDVENALDKFIVYNSDGTIYRDSDGKVQFLNTCSPEEQASINNLIKWSTEDWPIADIAENNLAIALEGKTVEELNNDSTSIYQGCVEDSDTDYLNKYEKVFGTAYKSARGELYESGSYLPESYRSALEYLIAYNTFYDSAADQAVTDAAEILKNMTGINLYDSRFPTDTSWIAYSFVDKNNNNAFDENDLIYVDQNGNKTLDDNEKYNYNGSMGFTYDAETGEVSLEGFDEADFETEQDKNNAILAAFIRFANKTATNSDLICFMKKSEFTDRNHYDAITSTGDTLRISQSELASYSRSYATTKYYAGGSTDRWGFTNLGNGTVTNNQITFGENTYNIISTSDSYNRVILNHSTTSKQEERKNVAELAATIDSATVYTKKLSDEEKLEYSSKSDYEILSGAYDRDGNIKTLEQWVIDLSYLYEVWEAKVHEGEAPTGYKDAEISTANNGVEVETSVGTFKYSDLTTALEKFKEALGKIDITLDKETYNEHRMAAKPEYGIELPELVLPKKEDYTEKIETTEDFTSLKDPEKAQWYVNLWAKMNGMDELPTVESDVIHDNATNSDIKIYFVQNFQKTDTTYSTNPILGYNQCENYIVIPDDMMNSNEWIYNVVSGAFGLIQRIDQKQHKFVDTSPAVMTEISEVPNEIAIKKAEAKYEADMKRIDLKDRKFDTDLAAIEQERNAIKQEIETLKTVAKDNVERTFKLFG